jgi:hypothetical protein
MVDSKSSTHLLSSSGPLALLSILLHAAVLTRYGWFRDEFYYVVCGRHLDWGYVDHPPLVALIARAVTALFGDSLMALRMVSVLAGAAVIFLAGWIARELGGGWFAQALAALCVLIAPVYLFMFHVFSMNPFDVLFWTLGSLVVIRLVKTGNPRLWLLFGAVAGLGLQNKHSVLFFGFGVAVALVLTPERRHLRMPWPWLGGLLAVLLFLPNVIWQAAHGWPMLEFAANAQANKNVALSPVEFLAEQILQMHPLTLPVWLAGLAWCLCGREGRRFRALGLIYLAVLAVLLTQRAKPYYLAPVYPVLFAAGAVAWESWVRAWRPGWLRSAVAALALVLLVLGGAALAPLALPVLPVEKLIRYQNSLGIQPDSGERHRMGVLPQHYADMHGWPEMVAEVARVYRSLPPQERAGAGIFGQNYGEAGAIDVLGRAQGLPPAMSGHNNYFLWGPQGTGDILIILGGDEEDNGAACVNLEPVGTIRCGHCMPYENDLPVSVCRGLKMPIEELWPRVKSYG